ncbi:MAG TPA: ABC transporter permease [Anaerovoracaceae bacterium]|nr:ABC transporter permease [Anaerovoracaceae bacterium]
MIRLNNYLYGLFQKSGLALLIIIIGVLFAVLTKGMFISGQNISNILVSSSLTGIVGIGMTFVLITGGIDLSVSGNVVMTSLIMATWMSIGIPWLLAIAMAICVSTMVGLINGISIGRFGMVAFVVTLAVSNITRGYGKLFSGGQTVYGLPEIHEIFGLGKLFGIIPAPIIMVGIVAIVASFVLNYTNYGRKLYAVGGNQKAAWMAGIKTTKIIVSAYVISGLLCGFGAVLITSKLMSASSTIASNLELDAIAACVIGGTSLSGGSGRISGTVLGAIAIAMIANGLNLTGVSPFAQEIAKGVIIFVVVAIDAYQKRKKVKNS